LEHSLPAEFSLSGAVVAFDLDGTLVDTAPDLVGALNVILDQDGLAQLPLKQARMMVGRGARGLLSQGFAAAGQPFDDEPRTRGLIARFIDVYLARIARESRPFEGVEAALDALIAEGARLCVCTNKYTDLSVALLDALDLSNRFVAVVGPDAAPAAKPDPRHLLAAIEAAGGRPDRALMVGDSAADVGAARAAHVPSIVVTFGYTEIAAEALGGDYLIDAFAELPALVTRLLTDPASKLAER
jgi:phosphoglycolate phosphatase